MGKSKRVWLLGIYLFLAVYLLPMFPHGGSANELTRWATAASLVENGSFEMSWTVPLIGKNVDTAIIDGRTYSNKAPGTAILAAPFYAVTRVIVGPPDASNIRISWFVIRFALSSLPLFFLALWLYRKGANEFSLATLLFATPLFVYSLLFFSHVLAGVLIYVAFRLIYDGETIAARNCLFAGLLCGLAVICEFPAVIPVAVLGLGILFSTRSARPKCVASFLAGGAPFVIFLLLYNASLFGSPFSMSYSHESFPEWAEVASQGVFGIGVPTFSNVILLLLSPSRGLFFTAPVLVLAVISFINSADRFSLRNVVKLAAFLATLIAMFGHGAAHGGWAFGPRYLVIIIPLMLDSFFVKDEGESREPWQELLFAVSLIFCVLPALTFPFAPPEFNSPHNDFWTRFLVQENWAVPNLASVLGLGSSLATLIPVVIAIAAVILIVATSRTRSRYAVAGILIGLAAAATWMFIPGRDSAEDTFRRATIAERYFKPANRLDVFRRAASDGRDWLTLRRVNDAEWNVADARAYAPNDFPYLPEREFQPSPSSLLAEAVVIEKRGDIAAAEKLLAEGKARFPFATCEFGTNLAVIRYTTGRKDLAIGDLESVQPFVNPASRSGCVRSQFLLGSLYQEQSRPTDAERVFRDFISNTEGSRGSEILELRKRLADR